MRAMTRTVVFVGVVGAAGFGVATAVGGGSVQSETRRAEGAFDVDVTPGEAPLGDRPTPGAMIGQMTIAKTFHGDLTATGAGVMLTALTDVRGSAAYVAMEHVTGTLEGRAGSFTFVHRGVMAGGAQELLLTVVPDSGTGNLEGISGSMSIRIDDDGAHFYDFEYSLPDAE